MAAVLDLPDAVLAAAFGLAGDAAAAALRATCRRFREVSHGVPFARLVLPRSREAADGLCAALAAGRVAGAAELRARLDAPRWEAVVARARAAGLRFRSVRVAAPDLDRVLELAARAGPEATGPVESLAVEILRAGAPPPPATDARAGARLAAAFPGVRELSLEGADRPAELAAAFPRLEGLAILGEGAAGPDEIAAIAALRGLRRLRLRVGAAGAAGVEAILRGAAGETLEEIRADGAHASLARLIEALGASRSLRRLAVDGASVRADAREPLAPDPRLHPRSVVVRADAAVREERVAEIEAWLRARDPALTRGLNVPAACPPALAARLVRASLGFVAAYARAVDLAGDEGAGFAADIDLLAATARARADAGRHLHVDLFLLCRGRPPEVRQSLERVLPSVEALARTGATCSVLVHPEAARREAVARGSAVEGVFIHA